MRLLKVDQNIKVLKLENKAAHSSREPQYIVSFYLINELK